MDKLKVVYSLCERYSISLAYLFGSCAEKAFHYLQGYDMNINDPLTDIDIGVVFEGALPGPEERLRLYAAVDNAFIDVFSPYRVDLSFLEENHAVFQVEAIKGYNIYAVSKQHKEDYEEMVLRRAADFKPVLDLFHKEALENVIHDH